MPELSNMSEIIIYEDADGQSAVQVRLDGETVWLTQKQMADLFESSADNIGLHLKNIYAEGELSEAATAEDYSVVQIEGKRQVTRTIKHYNLDSIISVGYRVNSKRGVRFRQWATNVLRRHVLQGYTLNQSRLAEVGIAEAQQALELLGRTLHANALVNDNGKEVVLNIQHAGEYFGEISLMDDGPRSASVMTDEACLFAVLMKQDFLKCISENPNVALRIIRGLTKRLRSLSENVRNLALVDVYGRVASLLTDLAVERNGVQIIEGKLTQSDIAARVGASPKMVGRIMQDLKNSGYVSK